MIEPFLDMERRNLAIQTMGVLGQVARSDDAALQLAIAQIAYDRGELVNVETSLTKAKRSARPGNPAIASIEEMWGLLKEKLGDADGAIEHYKESVALEPERELPLKRLATLYGLQKDFINGASWMERYVAIKPLALGHQYGTLGDYYLAAKDIPRAVQALQKGLEVDGYTFWARYRWAQLYEEEQDNELATSQYELALRYGPDRDPEIYARLAKRYKADGRTADAVKMVKTGMRIFPTNLELYRLYGEIGRGD